MKNILITGGAGFVGYHLTRALIKKGMKISVIDNLSTGKIENIPKKIEFIKGDIRDKKTLELVTSNCDVIIHLAAKTNIQESIKKPKDFIEINTIGTALITEICLKKNIKIIFFSSCSVYPLKYKKKILESSKLDPESPYAISKLAAEKIISFYTKYFGLKSYILRPFNIYGSRQSHESEYSAVIPKFITKSLNNDELTIYGNGNQKRDFVNVNDIITACIKCLSNDEKNKYGIYNVGTGTAISIIDLAKTIIKITGKGKIVYKPPKKTDANFSCADIGKIKKNLNFAVKNNFKNSIYKLIKSWKRNTL